MKHYKAIILEDNKVDADLIIRYLKRSDYEFEVRWVAKKDDFIFALDGFKPDIVISDYNLRYYNAYDVLEILKEHQKDIPVVIISGTIGEEEAVNLIKEGAIDFLIKHNLVRLPQIAVRALEETIEKKERTKAENELREEKAFIDLLLDSMSALFCLLDENLIIQRVNQRYLNQLGFTADEVLGRSVKDFVVQEDHPLFENLVNKVTLSGTNEESSLELRMQKKSGEIIHFVCTGAVLTKGSQRFILGTAIDITDRIHAENTIRKSLKEKEVLLAEVHHRVKNNLAVVSGMMQLQAMEDENEHVREKLMSSVNRIKSIAVVHEQMYKTESFSSLRFDESVKILLQNIENISDSDHIDIKTNFQIDEISLNINQAIPCAIIVNEVVTNMYKHAFKNQKEGEIYIKAHEYNNQVEFIFRDNGIGLPNGVDFTKSQSLGFKLVKLLESQIGGKLKITSDNGTVVHLQFSKADKKGIGNAYFA